MLFTFTLLISSPHQGLAGCPPAQSVAYPGVTRDSQFEPEMYWDKSVLDQRLQPAINFRNAHNVRVMCGEFGANVGAPDDSRGRWFADVIDLLETYGFDWSLLPVRVDGVTVTLAGLSRPPLSNRW